MKIRDLKIHSIAIADPPLRSSYGLHQPYALRTVLELVGDDGVVGLAEASPTGYREHGRFTIPQQSGQSTWSHPIIAGGLLIIRDQDTVWAYNVKGA